MFFVTLYQVWRVSEDTIQFKKQTKHALVTLPDDDQLECGNESVANQKIRLPLEQEGETSSELTSADWARVFIDEARSVIFFDTEGRSDMAESSVDNGKNHLISSDLLSSSSSL